MSFLFKKLTAQKGHSLETPKDVEYPDGMQKYKNTNRRRTGISAEVEDQAADTWVKRTVLKSEEAMRRIKEATSNSFLFEPLGDQQKQDIYDCMEEVKFSKGEFVIEQFADGDFFYVIDSGIFSVFQAESPKQLAKEGESPEEKKAREEAWPGRHLVTIEGKGSFGEIALMYNTPRTASVRADTDVVLFRLDRASFRHIVVRHAAKERKEREARLKDVPLLSQMTGSEISQIADILVTKTFEKDQYVIRYGEGGDSMYLVIEGEGVATHDIDGKETILRALKPGDYFGERAIITQEKRSANVKAVSDTFRVDSIDRATVERLFGSLKDLMKERMEREYSYLKLDVSDGHSDEEG